MDFEPLRDRSVAGLRLGRAILLLTLFLAGVSGLSPRADADAPAERDAGLIQAAAHALDLHQRSIESLEASTDQVVDPLPNDDLATEQRLGPALQSPQYTASFNCRSASLDGQPVASSNPARAPPSA